MQGACTKAPQAILARHDGRSRAHAARLLAASAAHESDADLVAAEAEHLTRSLRRILLQITLIKVCCYPAAAVYFEPCVSVGMFAKLRLSCEGPAR